MDNLGLSDLSQTARSAGAAAELVALREVANYTIRLPVRPLAFATLGPINYHGMELMASSWFTAI